MGLESVVLAEDGSPRTGVINVLTRVAAGLAAAFAGWAIAGTLA